jgi:hypothetical protein
VKILAWAVGGVCGLFLISVVLTLHDAHTKALADARRQDEATRIKEERHKEQAQVADPGIPRPKEAERKALVRRRLGQRDGRDDVVSQAGVRGRQETDAADPAGRLVGQQRRDDGVPG